MPSNHPLDFDPDALTEKFTGAEEESDSLPEAPSPTAADGDDYTIGEEIGRGGMGSVYRATDGVLQRDIALKSLTSSVRHSRTARARFQREARALAQLEHPNIVPVHQLGYDREESPYYTMKLVKGHTLKAILRAIKSGDRQCLAEYPLDRLLNIYRKVCDAIAFAHHKRILHRDLKPDNIMIGEYGEALVMDWGLAKFLDEEEDSKFFSEKGKSSEDSESPETPGTAQPPSTDSNPGLTMDGEVFGTPNYMAPEQAAGETEKIDPRTDVFSLGAILYEILTLLPPVTGDSSLDVIKRIVAGDIVAPTARQRALRRTDDDLSSPGGGLSPHCPGGANPRIPLLRDHASPGDLPRRSLPDCRRTVGGYRRLDRRFRDQR